MNRWKSSSSKDNYIIIQIFIIPIIASSNNLATNDISIEYPPPKMPSSLPFSTGIQNNSFAVLPKSSSIDGLPMLSNVSVPVDYSPLVSMSAVSSSNVPSPVSIFQLIQYHLQPYYLCPLTHHLLTHHLAPHPLLSLLPHHLLCLQPHHLLSHHQQNVTLTTKKTVR